MEALHRLETLYKVWRLQNVCVSFPLIRSIYIGVRSSSSSLNSTGLKVFSVYSIIGLTLIPLGKGHFKPAALAPKIYISGAEPSESL